MIPSEEFELNRNLILNKQITEVGAKANSDSDFLIDDSIAYLEEENKIDFSEYKEKAGQIQINNQGDHLNEASLISSDSDTKVISGIRENRNKITITNNQKNIEVYKIRNRGKEEAIIL